MKILAFAASNSSQSINRALVAYAAGLLEAGLVENADVQLLDINDYEMPLYSADREKEQGIPDLAQRFHQKIAAADALLISYAEHNGHYPAAYKNLFDWASRIDSKVYQGKPAVFLSASPGGGGAKSVLAAAVASAPFFAAEVKAELSVPAFHDNFDSESGKVSNAEIDAQLIAALKNLARH